MSAGIPWAVQERDAHKANVLPLPVVATERPVDRILWNSGGETVDEIVVHDCTVHLEQMTDQLYWIGIHKGEANIAIDLHVAKGKSPLLCTVRDDGPPPWLWDRDEEHI